YFRILPLQILNSTQTSTINSIQLDTLTQFALVVATISIALVSWYYMKKTNQNTEKQLKLTQKEIESRLRAELQIIIQESNLTKQDNEQVGMIRIAIKNTGTISARKVKVHFKDPTSSLDLPQLVRDEDEIKRSYFPVPGSIQPQLFAKDVIHRTRLNEPEVYEIAVWVTYEYADVKEMEFIQIIKINGQNNELGSIYEKQDIDEIRKEKRRRF
ncbi:MAG: hypothetical protein ACT4NJ_04550, partial [Nitrosopumilaceae archaeon]